MFIAHGEKFRKNIKWIMGLFAVAVSLSLVTFFTQTGGASRAANAGLPTIGGKPVDANVYQAARAALMAESIIDSGRELRRSPEVEDYLTQQAVVRLLMLRKAKELGLRVTDEECRNFIASQPVFHNEHGQFEPARYGQFAPFFVFLNNHGISLPEFEQLMRDRLTIRRLQEMVTASAVATPQEVNLVYTPLHERVTIELVSFSLNDYKQPITISNEEAQAFYDQNKETYRTPAQVKVRYAHFATAEEEKAVHVTDEEIAAYFERNKLRFAGTNSVAPELEAVKADVQKELVANRADRAAADRATEFSVRLVPKAAGAARPDFTAVSTEFAVKPQTTDFFSQLDKPVGATASVAFVQQAFAMTPDAPTSDPIPAPDGYYVIEYLDSKPSVIPTLDEVKDKVVDELKRLHAYEATVRQAQQTVEELKKLIAAGKSFGDACAALKLKIEHPEPFTFADEKTKLIAADRIKQESLALPVNGVSELIPTADGALVFHLKDRQPPDPETAEKDKPKWTQRVLQQNRQALFQSWVNTLVQEQGVNFGPRRSHPASTEPEPS